MKEDKNPAAEVTLETLRDAINALGTKFNAQLEAFTELEQRLDVMDVSMREVQAHQRDMALRPAANVVGAANMGADVMVTLQRILADVAELKERPIPALLAADLQKAQQASLKRAGEAHASDKMMYHWDPAAPKVAIVVASDQEERQAVAAGYFPSLDLAARAKLPADAAPEVVMDRVEQIRKRMFKVA